MFLVGSLIRKFDQDKRHPSSCHGNHINISSIPLQVLRIRRGGEDSALSYVDI